MSGNGRGGPPVSPVMLRASEILKDGQWYNLEKVYREVGKVIPPGQALRRNEKDRQASGKGPSTRTKPLTEDRRITAGKRAIVRDALMLKDYFEIDRDVPDRSERRIRMIQLPKKVQYAWEAMERNEYFNPEVLADKLQDDPHTSLSGLTMAELRRVVLVLVDRLGEREEGALEAPSELTPEPPAQQPPAQRPVGRFGFVSE